MMSRTSTLAERWTLRLIIITPMVALAILTVVITTFYIDKMEFYFKQNAQRYLAEYIESEKSQGEAVVRDIYLLSDYKTNRIEEQMKKELDERVALAYNTAEIIYKKYKGKLKDHAIKEHIKDALTAMTWYGKKNYIFITDYEGNNILSGAQKYNKKNLLHYSDADGRAIILEEIQLARKKGEGYLTTRFSKESSKQIMKIKDFGHFGWFFGSGMHFDRAIEKEKRNIHNLVVNAPKDRSGYILLYEDNRLIYNSEEREEELSTQQRNQITAYLNKRKGWVEMADGETHLYIRYIQAFDWYIVYGFKKATFNNMLQEQYMKMKANFDDEVLFVVLASIGIALLVAILTFIVTRRIIVIIQEYKSALQKREDELQELNSSLEVRVQEALDAYREKDKMLIQQSKMAAMGDMISMIAHQWRQPLNQMSFVLMNIDAAYEYKELTPKYLDEKIKEGTNLLEYMSHTIDDFKNFFKPDKAKSDEKICEVMQKTIDLVQKSLDSHNVSISLDVSCSRTLSIYRNELMQVFLNIINNAKDVLVEKEIQEGVIKIEITEVNDNVEVSICDNGGGVEEANLEKIFEPYFSTKEAKSGTGLGLYMAKTIVTEHLNGELRVSNSSDGACFSIVLKG